MYRDRGPLIDALITNLCMIGLRKRYLEIALFCQKFWGLFAETIATLSHHYRIAYVECCKYE